MSVDMSRKSIEGMEESNNNNSIHMDLQTQKIEGFDEDHGADGKIGPFYEASPDVEESSVEDDARYEQAEDCTEDSDTE